MKLIPVDQIPKMNGYHKLQDLIEEFVNGEAKNCESGFWPGRLQVSDSLPVLFGRSRQEIEASGQGMASW